MIQRYHNNIIRAITDARWYEWIDDFHSDLDLQFVTKVVKIYVKQRDKATTTKNDSKLDVRRLKWLKGINILVILCEYIIVKHK